MNENNHTSPSADMARTPITCESPPDAPPAASRDREARASIARLLEAISEYERTVALLRTTVLGLCVSRLASDRDIEPGCVDGSRANRTERGVRPNE